MINQCVEAIRSGAVCSVRWFGNPKHAAGYKVLSSEKGLKELFEIIEIGRAGGEILFFHELSDRGDIREIEIQ